MATVYKSHIYAASSTPIELKMQYGRLRYKQFSDGDAFVSLDHSSRVEFDEFDDMPTTLYLFAVAEDEPHSRLITGVRLMPTVVDYDMEMDCWKHLLVGIDLAKEPHIYAGGRWYGASHKTAEGRLGGGMLLQEMYTASQSFGFTMVHSFALSPCTNWMKKKNLANREAGMTYDVRPDGRKLSLNETPINAQMYELGIKQYRDALKEVDVESLEPV